MAGNGAGQQPRDEADEQAQAAAEALEPEAGVFGFSDPMGAGEAMLAAARGLVNNPGAVTDAWTAYAADLIEASSVARQRALGRDLEGPIAAGAKDRRFRDPAWEQNPFYFMLLQGYLLWTRLAREMVEAAELEEPDLGKVEFLTDMMVDGLAPTNFLATNPAAIKRAYDTGGASVARGVRNYLEDVANNRGMPRQVEPDAFTVGENLAVTPGKVVFRNHLMELIQYEAQTETVHETPLLLSPPWINKYYVMDLAPGRSFVEWAVTHGHTVFAISYVNPDDSHSDVRLDDYKLHGPIAALDVVQEITGADQVNVAGLCLGGTLTTMLLAYLASKDDPRVRSATLLNTLVDFSKPGSLGAFTDEASIERLERKMSQRGFLDKSEMMNMFTFMRSNDLVWNYAVNNWLMGDEPPAFDILAWNSDGTRMPAAMHSFFARACYLNNKLAAGEMEMGGQPLDLANIENDVYVLAAREDHITPWDGSYLTTQLLPNADVTFVLSSSGHIAGIVNPPSPKGWHRTNDQLPADHELWLAEATEHPGSWWEHWIAWLDERSGAQVSPPPLGSTGHPALDDAPGTYVHQS